MPQLQSRELLRRGQASPSLHSTASQTQRRVARLQVAVPDPAPTRHCASVVQPQRELAQTKPDHWSEHELLQPPQLWLLVAVFCSQPSSAPVVGRRQLANPGRQLELQMLPVHSRLATFADEQARPQLPQ